MNEQDVQQYLNLINGILQWENDEEINNLLDANPELVNLNLIFYLMAVADSLEDENESNWLQQIANSLLEYLAQSYQPFLGELLEKVDDSEGDKNVVYSFLRENLDKLNPILLYTLQQWWENTFNNDPQVSGDNVVWEVDDQILLYNKQTGTTTPLADTNFENNNPEISGNNVVWVGEEKDGDEEIVFYDGTSTVAITDNNFDDDNARISGNKIVWEGEPQGNDQIYFYDGDTKQTIQVTNNNFDNEDPRISGNIIVWESYDGNDEEIFFYNIDTKETIQITNNNSQDEDPEISGKNIVWEGDDGSDEEIFLYNVDTRETTQITNNNIDDEDPDISENNIVWEANNDIFLATPIDAPITPPETPPGTTPPGNLLKLHLL